ncbi:hypothetical protein L208DRAFT_1376574 [Tricholoma matsutake]|nr:hypothetical protein L208DRAFT_1376574 [Tricholoma matsutake 945]
MAKGYHKNNLTKSQKFQYSTPDADLQSSETDSESDCGYEGGVDCESSDDEYDPADEDGDWSDDKSFAELEGDELEANLHALHEEVESLDAPTVFRQMMVAKNAKEWKKVEGNRALGYTKNSTCTWERRRKEAQEQATFREKAKTS